jgi:histone H3/H4
MSANAGDRHRMKRTPAFRRPQLIRGSGKLKPGKLTAQESAFLRKKGGVDVPRASARRIAMRVIADTVPVISAENRRFAKRLEVFFFRSHLCKLTRKQLRGKHVPANLTVAPAHQWNLGDEALDHITALIQLSAKNLGKGAHVVADNDNRVTIFPSDVWLVTTLHREWNL